MDIISLVIMAFVKILYYLILYPLKVLYRALRGRYYYLVAHPLALYSLLFIIAFFGPSIYDVMVILVAYWLITVQYILQLLLLIPELLWNSLLAVISWIAHLADLALNLFGGDISLPVAFDLNGSGHVDTLLPFAPEIDWGQYVCIIGDPDFWPMFQIGHGIQFSSNPYDWTIVGGFLQSTGGHSVILPIGGGGPWDQPVPMGHAAIRVVNGQHPIWRWLPAL